MKNQLIITILLLSTLFISCTRGPEPIIFGKDMCAWCKMTIMDPKFGSELVTDKGRIYKFDDINCLVEYMEDRSFSLDDKHLMYVLDFGDPGNLIDAKSARYIFSREIRAPMASRIAAFGVGPLYQQYMEEWEGEHMTWEDVWKKFSEE